MRPPLYTELLFPQFQSPEMRPLIRTLYTKVFRVNCWFYINSFIINIHFSIFSILLVAIFITIRTVYDHTHNKLEIADQTIRLWPENYRSIFTVISYCSLSFICHFNLLPLQKELSGRQSKAKLYFIIVGAILIAYFVYNLVIFSAYFSVSTCFRIEGYRVVLISGGWNRGVPLHTEVASFQGVGIEEFHCIQRCPHFRVLE